MVLSELHFLRPAWFLALLPLALLLWHLMLTSRGFEVWRGQVDAHLLPHLLSHPGGRRHRPLALLALAWLLAVTALAGPVWERLPEPVHRTLAQQVILLDLSPTMLATDVAPSRLARARLEVLDLLRAGADGQTALIAFGAEPFLVSPLTTDAATIAAQVPSLTPDLLPVSGPRRTDLALLEALDLLTGAGGRAGELILITDGLDQPAAAFAAASKLAAAGHRLSLLPIAPADGLPGASPERDTLARLARMGGGRLVTLTADEGDTQALLAVSRGLRPGPSDDAGPVADQWREEGPWLLLPLLPLAALGFRRGWLAPAIALLFLLPGADGQAGGWADLWSRPDQQAARELAAGRPAAAAERFADPAWRAAARYQAGDYAGALRDLEGLAGVQADYNRGNALARAGRLAEAIAAYDRVLAADPGQADAAQNRALVERLLKQNGALPNAPNEGGSGQGPSATEQGGEGSAAGESAADTAGDSADDQGGDKGQTQSQPDGEHAGPDGDPSGSPSDSDNPGPSSAAEPAPAGDATQADDGKGRSAPGPGGSANEPPEPSEAGHDQDKGNRAADAPETAPSSTTGPAGEAGAADSPVPGQEPGIGDLLGPERAPAAAQGTPPGDGQANPAERESRQALEQMLRRVPDDPAGLLRQRFLLQYLRRHGRL